MKKLVLCIATICFAVGYAQVKDSVKTIEKIEIVAKKKLLERKADRMIFNVDASVATQGMDGAETLANVPMLKVDDNGGIISIIGKSSVAVMINGKMLNLSGTPLINYLKSLRSENIAKIEVITTPPAKYDAQGNSGLINIILKKNPNIGFSGNLSTGLVQRTYSGFSDNLTLNYQNEKLNVSGKLAYWDSAKRSEENYTILGKSQNYSTSVRKDMWFELSPSVNISYKISKNSEIGANILIGRQKPSMNIMNVMKNIDTNATGENFTTQSLHREKNLTETVSVYYDLKLDSLGRKLSLAGNYYGNNSDTKVNFSTMKISDGSVQNVETLSYIKPQILSVQADLELPLSYGNIETGAKITNFKNSSDLRYFDLHPGIRSQDFSRSDFFLYQEKNYAAYFSFAKNFGEHWETKAGLRYEYTSVAGDSPESDTRNDYSEWFPTAFISYKTAKNVYSLSFSRRINRPDMDNLNPFRWYENPYSYSSGNPLLKPSYLTNLELSYTYNNKFSASVYYLFQKNGFGQTLLLDGLMQIGTYLNYYNTNYLGTNLSYTEKVFPWWESVFSANASLTKSELFNVNAVPQNGKTLSFASSNSFILNKSKTIVLFVNYNQTLPYKNGNYSFRNFSDLTSGLKISLMDKKLQINATVTNIFAQRSEAEIFYNDNTQHFNNYWDGRSFRLTFNYNFGSIKLPNRIKHIDFEEKSRAK